MQTLEAFVASSIVLPLFDTVVQKTIELRKTHKIKLPDAVIDATAIVYDLTIITRNISDFEKIPGLEVINSHGW
ncbi:MAG: type II toxin-antitoxin system VapC family toxin [Verrucomicrobiae bacterium]|nr:type II toxin-antitoxin system VapC family toxin [Verrucomicrobiae bacterium]